MTMGYRGIVLEVQRLPDAQNVRSSLRIADFPSYASSLHVEGDRRRLKRQNGEETTARTAFSCLL